MADSQLILPGDFQAGKTYFLRGETLLAWRKALIADRALPGEGLKETATPIGRQLSVIGERLPVSPFHAYLYARGVCRISSGRLIASPADGSLITISGLDANIALTTTLKVALSVSMDVDFEITGASLAGAASWPEDAATFDGTFPDEYQSSATIRVGEVSAGKLPEGTPGFEFSLDGVAGLWHFEQLLHTHLFMALIAYDGKAALFPLPWSG